MVLKADERRKILTLKRPCRRGELHLPAVDSHKLGSKHMCDCAMLTERTSQRVI